ncbi:hypothetical protein LCGC14_0251660 [marine sediment metagenome]|uniref:Peripheral subunit-binding (PSBD) domain-containing protein n=1 Tax=marine sediment metagenome TaxID=412755 RepID=A0A0F9U908_9ZZZZ
MGNITHHNIVEKNLQYRQLLDDDQSASVDFASERAGEVAAELGFTASRLEGREGSGKDGAITVADVRDWV